MLVSVRADLPTSNFHQCWDANDHSKSDLLVSINVTGNERRLVYEFNRHIRSITRNNHGYLYQEDMLL
jgi:hypothetical protein